MPLWDQVKPLIAEAIGKKVDQAALFGVDKPASWPTAVIPAATAAGNTQATSEHAAMQDSIKSLAHQLGEAKAESLTARQAMGARIDAVSRDVDRLENNR